VNVYFRQDGKNCMKLRRPQDELAGCCWLARMADKVRASQEEGFPLLYRLSLGSPIGIDGFFLRHFKMAFRQLREAVLENRNDENLARWFLSQPGVTPPPLRNGRSTGPSSAPPGIRGRCYGTS
jgi:hypothetical protein